MDHKQYSARPHVINIITLPTRSAETRIRIRVWSPPERALRRAPRSRLGRDRGAKCASPPTAAARPNLRIAELALAQPSDGRRGNPPQRPSPPPSGAPLHNFQSEAPSRLRHPTGWAPIVHERHNLTNFHAGPTAFRPPSMRLMARRNVRIAARCAGRRQGTPHIKR